MKKVIWMVLFCLVTGAYAEWNTTDAFGRRVYNQKGRSTKSEELTADVYGIYFSAHWCPPCRGFTPVLVDFYNEVKEAGGNFEILFVSSDRSEDAMFEYMEEMDMPWFAAGHQSSEGADLKKLYEISGIPSFVILDSNGKLITKNGRGAVGSKGIKAWEEWKKAAGTPAK